MIPPRPNGHRGRGLLLLRGEPAPVARWVARGLVASHVVALPGWTAVVPVEVAARGGAVLPAYGDPVTVLASRPVDRRLRASIGLFTVERRAVVTVQAGAWRALQRWVAWEPGRGAVRLPRLPVARPGDLVAAAGAGRRGTGGQVGQVLADPRGDAVVVLADLMRVLGLPGDRLLDGSDDPAAGAGTLVEPRAAEVARFEALVHEEARHRAELEED